MKSISRLFLVLAVILPVEAIALDVEGFSPDQKITYKVLDEDYLQLHVFFPKDHKTSEAKPAIVFFFGGGWNGGSPSQFYPHCQYLASRGMVAMTAEYRTKNSHGNSPIECVKDGKSAIRWVRQHANELGINKDRIAAGGGSAGGHVAAAVATTDGFEEDSDNLSVSCRPSALVLFNPVFDNGPDGYGYDRVKDYWKAFSPMHNIDSDAPPTIVFLGTKDKLIPVSTAKEYENRMQKAGVRCDLHLYKDQPHGFFNYRNHEFYFKTVLETDRFLKSLGYLEGNPTLRKNDPNY